MQHLQTLRRASSLLDDSKTTGFQTPVQEKRTKMKSIAYKVSEENTPQTITNISVQRECNTSEIKNIYGGAQYRAKTKPTDEKTMKKRERERQRYRRRKELLAQPLSEESHKAVHEIAAAGDNNVEKVSVLKGPNNVKLLANDVYAQLKHVD
jgi:hypothetical protein